ncbi:hypothetical protein PMIN03_010675 [Paraphaeosphaeria minitans]
MAPTKVLLLVLAAVIAGAEPSVVTSTTIAPASMITSASEIAQVLVPSNTSSVQPTTVASSSSGASSGTPSSQDVSGTEGAAAPTNVPFGTVLILGLPVVLGMI